MPISGRVNNPRAVFSVTNKVFLNKRKCDVGGREIDLHPFVLFGSLRPFALQWCTQKRSYATLRTMINDIEIVHQNFARGSFRAALFDFDGTLSLLRRNWQDVMIPMMVDILAETGTTETRAQLSEQVEEFVMRLNEQANHLPNDPARRGSDQAWRKAARTVGVQAPVP